MSKPGVEETIRSAAYYCGVMAAECSDAAGISSQVKRAIMSQQDRLHELNRLTEELDQQQALVLQSTITAQDLTARARESLMNADKLLRSVISDSRELASDALALGDQASALRDALANVGNVTKSIRAFAQQSRILALNATIEVGRIGAAGSTFEVVASELSRMAISTQAATIDVSRIVADLSDASLSLIASIQSQADRARSVSGEFDTINATLDTMGTIVGSVDVQTADIAVRGQEMSNGMSSMRSVFVSFTEDASRNGYHLENICTRLENLEAEGNQMLDKLSQSGVETIDTPFIVKAQAVAREIENLVNGAISAGRIVSDQVFDSVLRPVENSDPPQFVTGFVDFADHNIRPILDRVAGEDRRMIGCVVSDLRGYLPTHLTLRSQPQRSDSTWNDTWSRNRRILLDPATARAISSEAPAILTCYRMPLGAGRYLTIKSVFVPLHFSGQRWGQYEFSYVDEWNETAQSITGEGLALSLTEN
jgi:methyl-accepting chemotaxis protein